jgi:serine/threonine protein kinase
VVLNPGEVLNNRYLIIKPLGLGGFGAVYRAEDVTLKTTCALKENLDYWTEAQRQFEREALLLAQCAIHPATTIFQRPRAMYLVMDFVKVRISR